MWLCSVPRINKAGWGDALLAEGEENLIFHQEIMERTQRGYVWGRSEVKTREKKRTNTRSRHAIVSYQTDKVCCLEGALRKFGPFFVMLVCDTHENQLNVSIMTTQWMPITVYWRVHEQRHRANSNWYWKVLFFVKWKKLKIRTSEDVRDRQRIECKVVEKSGFPSI